MKTSRARSKEKPRPMDDAVQERTARKLVRHIIPLGSNDAVKAFISLVNAIAHSERQCDRENIAMYACNEAYLTTTSFDEAQRTFCDAASAEFPVAA